MPARAEENRCGARRRPVVWLLFFGLSDEAGRQRRRNDEGNRQYGSAAWKRRKDGGSAVHHEGLCKRPPAHADDSDGPRTMPVAPEGRGCAGACGSLLHGDEGVAEKADRCHRTSPSRRACCVRPPWTGGVIQREGCELFSLGLDQRGGLSRSMIKSNRAYLRLQPSRDLLWQREMVKGERLGMCVFGCDVGRRSRAFFDFRTGTNRGQVC